MYIKEFRVTGCNQILLNDYHRKLDSTANFQLNFLPSDKQVYAFDYLGSGDHGIFANNEYYPKSGSYDFRYKSVKTSQTDYVKVDFSTYRGGDKENIVFKDRYGIKLKLIDDNTLAFTASNKPDTNYIYAYDKDGVRIGKLFVYTYNQKIHNVFLVPVKSNGTQNVNLPNVEEVSRAVKKTFNQSVTSFKFQIVDPVIIPDLTTFTHGGSKWTSVFNDDQKKVLEAYDDKMNDNDFYLFFVDNVLDKFDSFGTSVAGYMPRGYNCGFIYDGGSPRTIAHELGLGVGNLEHAFEKSNTSGKTKNLMDYSDGEELYHFQWNEIQDPSRVWLKWSKDESEGEYDWLKSFLAIPDPICVLMFIEKFRRAYAYHERFETNRFSELANITLLYPEKQSTYVKIDTKATSKSFDELYYDDYFVSDEHTNEKLLKDYLFPNKGEYDKAIDYYLCMIPTLIKHGESSPLFNFLTIFPNQEYLRIPIDQRIEILKIFSKVFLFQAYLGCTDEEKIVINLIKYTPNIEDKKKVLNLLFKSDSNGNLFELFKSRIDNDNYLQYLVSVCQLWNSVNASKIQSVRNNLNSELDKVFIWSDNMSNTVSYSTSIINNKIEFKYNISMYGFPTFENGSEIYDYQDLIMLKLETVPDFFFSNVSNKKALENKTVIIPAFIFQSVIDKIRTDAWVNCLDVVVTTTSFIYGIGELKVLHSLSKGKKFMTILGLTMDGYSLATKYAPVNEWLKKWLGKIDPYVNADTKKVWETLIIAADIKNIIELRDNNYKELSGKLNLFKIGWASFKQDYFISFKPEDKEMVKAIDELLVIIEANLEQ
ncbi:MAG: hypothetical protein MJ211_15595 [Bacteroidales bacterium]|nr:hypothetical protein [Bacteroidales bacterium]